MVIRATWSPVVWNAKWLGRLKPSPPTRLDERRDRLGKWGHACLWGMGQALLEGNHKGVGEIGQVGTAAAIANAVFHATGRRIRELPMAPELVMDPAP
jgi:hypothetical protein